MEDRHLAVMIAQRCLQYGDRVAMRYKSGETWQEITHHAAKRIAVVALQLSASLCHSEEDRIERAT